MPHALATHLGLNNLNAALLTHDAAMTKALVLSADALIVLHRAEYLGTEKTVSLWLKSTVVDRFWLSDLTE
jgi:hypothetical protein